MASANKGGINVENDNSASKGSYIRDSLGSASGSIPSRLEENGILKNDGETPFNFSDIINNEQQNDNRNKNLHSSIKVVEGTGGSGTSEVNINLRERQAL